MRRPLSTLNHDRKGVASEAGFVLVAAMVVLLALTLFGIWAIRTSTLELDIAGSVQRAEKQFNVAEGAVMIELGNAAAIDTGDTGATNVIVAPTTEATFDPGSDTAANPASVDAADPASWPMGNLLQDNADDEFDYRYLVTFLYADSEGRPGYAAGENEFFYYRIQGQSVEGNNGSLVIEVGGYKVGVKS